MDRTGWGRRIVQGSRGVGEEQRESGATHGRCGGSSRMEPPSPTSIHPFTTPVLHLCPPSVIDNSKSATRCCQRLACDWHQRHKNAMANTVRKLCKFYFSGADGKTCQRGSLCTFAHDWSEVGCKYLERDKLDTHHKWVLCKFWAKQGSHR